MLRIQKTTQQLELNYREIIKTLNQSPDSRQNLKIIKLSLTMIIFTEKDSYQTDHSKVIIKRNLILKIVTTASSNKMKIE